MMHIYREYTVRMLGGVVLREREREQGKENGSIIVEFCCSSEAHAPSRETKQRAQLGNY